MLFHVIFMCECFIWLNTSQGTTFGFSIIDINHQIEHKKALRKNLRAFYSYYRLLFLITFST